MFDPLEFYGYEDEQKAREYRKRKRIERIEAWRRPKSDPGTLLDFVKRMIYGMPALG